MTIQQQPTARARQQQPAIIFKQSLRQLTYAGIPPLRREMLGFLQNHGVDRTRADTFLLSASEILTNLLKHPPEKAGTIIVTLTLLDDALTLDVADNSTPFATFDAKCKDALSVPPAGDSLQERGYGLSCILKQHKDVCYVPARDSQDGFNHFRLSDAALPRKVVFLVDDDPVVLKLQHRALSPFYDVVPLSRAEDALALFSQQAPDIVISDLNMPGIDGMELRRRLSQLPDGNTTPFIFVSSAKAQRDSPYINELGVDDFLCKPVSEARLLNVVARLLTRAQQVRSGLEGKFHADVSDYLKPSLPESCRGWRIRVYNRMAEAGGGDFTFYQETPECLMAVLADVMGHGTQAKFFAYAYAGYLRSMFRFMAGTQDPARFLQHLSKTVEHDAFLESIIITCQGLQLFDDGRAAIASAGHPPPLLLKNGAASDIDIAGPLPGLAGDSPYRLAELKLSAGDRLLFATDGFFQAFDLRASQRAGLTKALDAVGGNIDRLWNAFDSKDRHAAQPDDDATLIVAEYGGHP